MFKNILLDDDSANAAVPSRWNEAFRGVYPLSFESGVQVTSGTRTEYEPGLYEAVIKGRLELFLPEHRWCMPMYEGGGNISFMGMSASRVIDLFRESWWYKFNSFEDINLERVFRHSFGKGVSAMLLDYVFTEFDSLTRDLTDPEYLFKAPSILANFLESLGLEKIYYEEDPEEQDWFKYDLNLLKDEFKMGLT